MLLEELEKIDYKLRLYQRDPALGLAPPELKIVAPLGTSLSITDDDEDISLSESNAIIEYILDMALAMGGDLEEKAKLLQPMYGTKERKNYLFWFHTSAATLQFLVSIDAFFHMAPHRVPQGFAWIMKKVGQRVEEKFLMPRLVRILDLAEEQLSRHDYFAGDHLTAADVTILYSFDALLHRRVNMHVTYPNCSAWYDRMKARPAFQRALQKAGEDRISYQFTK